MAWTSKGSIQGPTGATGPAGSPLPRVTSIASSATPTVNLSTTDHYDITALVANITSLSTSGTPGNWQTLWVTIKAAGAQTIAWNAANFANSGGVSWPTSVPAGKTITAAGKYNPALGKMVCYAADPGY